MSETVAPGTERHPTTGAVGRKVGYVVAAGLNLVALWLVDQLLGWGWPPFLTSAFEELLPVLRVSFVATAVVNLVWVVWEPAWFRHLAQAVLDGIGLVVTVRTWQVFPFDLSSGWETIFRVVLVVALVGITIATVVEAVKFVAALGPRLHPTGERHHRPHPA